MPNVFKTVRDAVRTALADPTNGFNTKLAALAAGYGVNAFEINWTSSSSNFMQANLNADEIEVSQFITSFPAATLYGISAINEHKEKFTSFSGQVIVQVDFYLWFRALKDAQHAGNVFEGGNDLESIGDAVVDAALSCLHDQRATMAASGARMFDNRADKEFAEIRGDGHTQRVSIALGFERHV